VRLDFFQEQIFFAVVRVTSAEPGSTSQSIGTGFIYAAPLPERPDYTAFLLISNRHVFGVPERRLRLNFHKRHSTENLPLLGEIAVFEAEGFSRFYTQHPDPAIDLACLNVSGIAEPGAGVFYKHLTEEVLTSPTDLMAGHEVWFLGYPNNRFDVTNNLPLLRRGYIASVPSVDFNGRPQMVIDAGVFPGSSGSPVFVSSQGVFYLAGVVSETMIRHGQLQTLPTGVTFGVEQVLGLGIIIKAAQLRPMIDLALQQAEAIQQSRGVG
jgi:trypsin-like peptidase